MENFVKNLDHVGVEFTPPKFEKKFSCQYDPPAPLPHIFALLLPPYKKSPLHFFATISKHHFFEKILNPKPKNLNVVKKFSILSFFLPSGKFLKIDITKKIFKKPKFHRKKILQKKLTKNKFYLNGACSLYVIIIIITAISTNNYYIFAKWC